MTEAGSKGTRWISRVSVAVALACCGAFAVGTAVADTVAPDGCYPIPAAPVVGYAKPPNLDLIKDELLYYRCAQYDADIAAVLDDAKKWVASRAPQVTKPAIVFDIDETSLSNWTRIYGDGFAYFYNGSCNLDKSEEPCGDIAWQESEKAPAIGPTLELYKLARCIDVAPPCQPIDVFFVTGRKVNDPTTGGKTPTQWTGENLDKAGYKGLPPDRPVAPYKSSARADIERRFGVTIIANVGDQDSDLAGGHAERTFKVPNPFYYIP